MIICYSYILISIITFQMM